MAFNGVHSSSSLSFSSSSSFTHQWTYDVFLSFRGEDTRNNFTAHLYAALCQKGINTYLDNDLKRGENISPALLKAIEESRISIIVISQNYASSSWCLNELATILECKETKGQMVLPVFYKVNPSEIRHQRNNFGKAFAEHEERFKDDQMKVQRWKTALTQVANLCGLDLENYRKEPEFIREIIEWVDSILVIKTYFQVAQYPVGIQSRVQVVQSHLNIEKKDITCMVGIFGIGGIGKTTLAKAIFNSIAYQFEGSCFLGDIRDTSSQAGGLIYLQKELLSKILGGSSLMVDNVDQGMTLIKQRLRSSRVLLIFDDVDQSVQLEKLAGKSWFGLGSRIIITTRDEHLLRAHDGVDSVYRVNELDHNEALELFSWHAFNKDKPNESYEEVTEDAVRYAGGLPLALTVLGATLKRRDILYWKSKLDGYKRIPPGDIQKKLRISFDGLDENAKNSFLDIACFFKGQNVNYVKKILDSCGFHSNSCIGDLKDKCLITEDWGLLVMHNLLQEMGREIVRQESKEAGERSRLWFHEDVRHVLQENTGTKKVEGILIDLHEPDRIRMSPKAFKKMKRLRMFINHNAHIFEEPNFLPNALRVLIWPEYPGKSLPSNFRGDNLVDLRMPHSCLKNMKRVQNFQNVIIMNLQFCKFLRKIPDVSRIPNLEILDLYACENLVKVHHSVGLLDRLVDLNLCGCTNLRSFPRSLKLRSLKKLNLESCYRIKNFPEIECQMESIEYINFADTGIEELPSSIGYLVGVKDLDLGNCTNLKNLPDSIHQLQHLRSLGLRGCTGLKELPSSFGYLVGLEDLVLNDCTNLLHLPNGFYQLQHLGSIQMINCKQLREIPRLPPNLKYMLAYGCKSLATFLEEARRSQFINTWGPPEPMGFGMCLKELDLSGSDIVTLPQCIECFVALEELKLENCKQLREILGQINVRQVKAKGCVSLEIFLGDPRMSQLINTGGPAEPVGFGMMFPAGFKTCVGLKWLFLEDCKQLREIPALPPSIEVVSLGRCTSLERLPFNNIYDLPMLQWIDLSDCSEHIRNDLQIHLFSEGHPKEHRFGCIFPGNKIPNYFNHHKEVSNTNSCEMDIHERVPLDLENTRFSFSAVIGTEDVQDEIPFIISVKVINNGQEIYSHGSFDIRNSAGSDHVWLHYHSSRNYLQYHGSHNSQLKTNNLRVKFKCWDNYGKPPKSTFFKSCGFYLEQKYEEKVIDLRDGIQHSKRCRDDNDDDDSNNLESNWYPQQKRHSSTLGIRISDEMERPLSESQLHQ